MDRNETEQYEKISQFLYEMNQQPEYHVNYLGRSQERIMTQLEQHGPDHIAVLYEGNDIIAVVGIETITDGTAHVFGPITARTDAATSRRITALCEQLINKHPDIKDYEFYISAQHSFGRLVMKSLRTQYLGTRYTMAATRLNDNAIDTRLVIPYSPIYKKSFKTLMKNLYINPKERTEELLELLDKSYELFILLSEGIVKGYIVLAANNQTTCYVDYVVTHKNYRHQGIGHQLVTYAAEHAFKEHEATEIQLSVEDKRKRTIEFYEKLGFKKVDELHHYKYSVN
ncbi:GNAT family N-acetyltransferase [Macrococcus equipercicus]|uniref:GNAT family N-acetyltransferase n=1 Tax=Macrococcus equipercicus TaxID=69967 RepID=A0A9Q9F248_9STAP|nr:GNAT family N-acetyltransferase [Macrococcus equipercicus]UTH14006.1 GNAT family N-acetyltransferase [Macrococcus equipercicus]